MLCGGVTAIEYAYGIRKKNLFFYFFQIYKPLNNPLFNNTYAKNKYKENIEKIRKLSLLSIFPLYIEDVQQ